MKRKLYTVNQKGNDTRFPPLLGQRRSLLQQYCQKEKQVHLGHILPTTEMGKGSWKRGVCDVKVTNKQHRNIKTHGKV